MDNRTAQKRALELLHHAGVAARIAELQKAAADNAVLSQSWVLDLLAEKTIKLKVPQKDEDGGTEIVEVEMTRHDATAANRALELLMRATGRTRESGWASEGGILRS